MKMSYMCLHADVLIVTVTKVESQAVIETLKKETESPLRLVPIADKIYHDFGQINNINIFMTISEMGTGDIGATILS